jgi:TctA family transporter
LGPVVATLGFLVVAPLLANFALQFGPPEFFSLMVLGLSIVIYISFGSVLKAVIMGCLGVALGCIGWDVISGRTYETSRIWMEGKTFSLEVGILVDHHLVKAKPHVKDHDLLSAADGGHVPARP